MHAYNLGSYTAKHISSNREDQHLEHPRNSSTMQRECLGQEVKGGEGGGVVCVKGTSLYMYIDGHESKLVIIILGMVEKSQQTSNDRYFATYSFHVLT